MQRLMVVVAFRNACGLELGLIEWPSTSFVAWAKSIRSFFTSALADSLCFLSALLIESSMPIALKMRLAAANIADSNEKLNEGFGEY